MATIYPFRALRPEASLAARIASVPYDVVNTDEARALADGNPLSFPACVAGRNRAAAEHRSLRRRGLRTRRRQLRAASESALVARSRAERFTSTGCEWAPTNRPASPRAFRSTSTTATSSRSTSARGATRKTIARGTCSRSARKPDRCSSPTARRTEINAIEERVTAGAPLFDFEARRRCAAHGVARRRGQPGAARTGCGVRGDPRALHRGRPPSRGERGARGPNWTSAAPSAGSSGTRISTPCSPSHSRTITCRSSPTTGR